MIQQYNGILAIEARWLFSDAQVVSKHNYDKLSSRGHIEVVRRGCRGTSALVAYETMPDDLKAKVRDLVGDPYKEYRKSELENMIEYDEEAAKFFREHTKPDGRNLSMERQRELIMEAQILNAVGKIVNKRIALRRGKGGGAKGVWENVSKQINALDKQKYPHSLPNNPRRLQGTRKYKDRSKVGRCYWRYVKEGYIGLLHAGEGNDNSAKIKGDVADWLIAMYSMPIKMSVPQMMARYEIERGENQWPTLSEDAVSKWLMDPENKRLWLAGRDGKEAWIHEFGHYVKRKREKWFPNAYWAIDGSKLDWMHYEESVDSKVASRLKIDVVFDVYSEKVIGWAISESEDMVDHFKALKMALNNTGAKPYLLTYDNQGGHKNESIQMMYDNLVASAGGTHYPNKPRSHSNPSEQLFGRLQKQVLNQFWFSDKQGVRTKTNASRPNPEFLAENRHKLWKKKDLIKAVAHAINLWNTSKHPKYKTQTREEVAGHAMPMSEPVEITDMINIFWVMTKKPITYKRGGLMLRVNKQEYEYEVLDGQGRIDVEFRRVNIGRKFYVKYDPEHLGEYVQLWVKDESGEHLFVSNAQPKRAHEEVPVLMQDGDKEQWQKDYVVKNDEFNRDMGDLEATRRRAGVSIEALMADQELLLKTGSFYPKKVSENAETDFLNGL